MNQVKGIDRAMKSVRQTETQKTTEKQHSSYLLTSITMHVMNCKYTHSINIALIPQFPLTLIQNVSCYEYKQKQNILCCNRVVIHTVYCI